MADDPDPPRKFFQLKPKEFERLNEAPREPGPAANTNQSSSPTESPADPGRIDVRDLARQAAGGAPQLGVNAPVNRPNDVHAILEENLQRANAAGLNNVTLPRKRRSRRNRDFALMFVAGNALLILGFVIQPVFAGAGLVLYNVGLPWIMFVVMDDY